MATKTNSLRITRIRLENWMNFVVADVPTVERLFLVGPNASGKSNFLDALRFLRDLASSGGGLQEAVRVRHGVSAIRCLAARHRSEIGLSLELHNSRDDVSWVYTVGFTQEGKQTVITREAVERNGKLLLSRPDSEDAADPDRLTQTAIEQVNVNKQFRELNEFFATIRYLHIVPQLVREPERAVSRENDPFGSDFLEQVAQVNERTRTSRLRHIAKVLKVAVPQLEELEMVRDARGAPHLRGRYRHWRPQGAWQGEGQFSDGTLRLLGLLWVMMDRSPGPLLLEEPELSLHSGVVAELPQLLARVQRKTGRQVFLSTHSPDLLRDDGIGLDEVVLLIPGKEGTEVTVAKELADVRALLDAGLTMAEAVVPRTYPAAGQQLSLFEG